MTAAKSLRSNTLLFEYCLDRYGVRLSTKQLSKLVAAAFIFNPLNADNWLKIQLIELNCFPCGCTCPPLIRLTVTLHIDWCKGLMPTSGRNEVKSGLRFDRRRLGRTPGMSGVVFDGSDAESSYWREM